MVVLGPRSVPLRMFVYTLKERHSRFLSYRTGARYVLSAVSVFIVAQPSSEVPERLMNYPVYSDARLVFVNVARLCSLCSMLTELSSSFQYGCCPHHILSGVL
jgi:hypothetical protein